jgi:hypothetical protein
MSRRAVRSLHLAASLTAVAIVASFLAATLAAEVVGGDAPTEVKHWIARAVVVLVPVIAGASNLALLSLNVRDGLAMRARRTSLRARGSPGPPDEMVR